MKLDMRKLLIRIGVVVVLVALGALMMLIGRGHTVYFDNKTIEYNGAEYPAFYQVKIDTKSLDKPAQLKAGERSTAKCIGQSLHLELEVTAEKGGASKELSLDVSLPYGMDNPILNLPALLAELPQEAWLDEFIPAPPSDEPDDTDPGDILGGDLGIDPGAGIME